jgi:hypothetical protein
VFPIIVANSDSLFAALRREREEHKNSTLRGIGPKEILLAVFISEERERGDDRR